MPITKPAWPLLADVKTLIGTVPNAIAPGDDEIQDELDGAVNDFEDQTGNVPFLADGAASARTFDPADSRILFLRGSAVAITDVRIFVQQGSAGTQLTLGQDYFLLPENAAVRGRPFTRLRLMCDHGGYPQSIQITARWGFADAIPVQAWNAVLKRAARRAIGKTMATSGPESRLKLGTQERDYGIQGVKTTLQDWDSEFDAAVMDFNVRPVI